MAKTGGGYATNATGGGTDTSSWWDLATFGPNVEVYVTITQASAIVADTFKLFARIVTPGIGAMSGYELHVEKSAGTDIWRLRRRDNQVATVLGADMNQEIASGDSVGLSVVGSTVSAYYKPGAGAWTLVGTRTDATYSAVGYIGIKTTQTSPGAWRSDNFSGGTTVTSTAPSAPQSLQATGGDSQITLTWSAPATNGGSTVTAYKIYRSSATGTEVLYASPTGTGTSYVDGGTINGTFYYYQVTAINAIGESARSNEASTSPSAPAVTPTTLTYKRLYGPTQLGNAAALLYTCPASTTAVVRHVHVSNPTGAPVNFTLLIGSNVPASRLWDATPIDANDVLDHYQEFTLIPGEIIQGFASSAGALNLTIDGYEVGAASAPPAAGPIYPSDTLFPSLTSP